MHNWIREVFAPKRIIIGLSIALAISLGANLVHMRRFEQARQAHVWQVINSMLYFSTTLWIQGYDRDFGEAVEDRLLREMFLAQTWGRVDELSVSLSALINHHGHGRGGRITRQGLVMFPWGLISYLATIYRYDADPSIQLLELHHEIHAIFEQLYEGMSTQSLFDIIDTASEDIFRRLDPRRFR